MRNVIQMNYDLRAFSKKAEKHLDEERYVHTLGVMYTAAALAMAHGGDLKRHRQQECFMTVRNVYQMIRN